jgi:hypothetical protein
MVLAGCDDPPQPTPGSATSTMEVAPTAAFRACRTDEDCRKVSSSCNGCCQEAAVNADSVAAYEAYRMNHCAGYRGPICNCMVQPARVHCLRLQCTLESTDGG